MNRKILVGVAVLISGLFLSADLLVRAGRGGRGGGGGGGGRAGGGGGGGARPAPSRPAVGSGIGAGGGRPAAAPRPSPGPGAGAKIGGAGGAKVGGGGANVGGGGGLKAGGPGPGAATRPSQGQLQNFLNVGGPGSGGPKGGPGIGAGVGAALGAGASQGALNDFFNGPGPGGPGAGRPGAGGPDIGKGAGKAGDGKLAGGKPGDGKLGGKAGDGKLAGKAGQSPGDRPAANNRPERVENRQQLQQQRQDRRQDVRNEFRDNHPRFDFAMEHPRWAAWRVNSPYRWAAAAAIAGWVGWGAGGEASYYDYGENMYYQDGAVYSDGQQVATAEKYEQVAEQIATSIPAVQNPDWMPLGVFAITQDGQSEGPTPTMFVQLNVSKEGIIAGSFQNSAAGTSQPIEGTVDKRTQRAAWLISGKNRPIMETGIFNLTKDTAPALVHFADGQTQQWLLVRLDEPKK